LSIQNLPSLLERTDGGRGARPKDSILSEARPIELVERLLNLDDVRPIRPLKNMGRIGYRGPFKLGIAAEQLGLKCHLKSLLSVDQGFPPVRRSVEPQSQPQLLLSMLGLET